MGFSVPGRRQHGMHRLFNFPPHRDSKAALRFQGNLPNSVKKWQIWHVMHTANEPTYRRELVLLKRDGRCPPGNEHRQIKS